LPQLRDSKEKIFAGPLKVARDLIHLLVVPDRRKAERKEREIQMNKHAQSPEKDSLMEIKESQ
jgi:hypothetical protein